MFGSICPCGIEGFAWLDKQEICVLSDSACVYEHAGQCELHGISHEETALGLQLCCDSCKRSHGKSENSAPGDSDVATTAAMANRDGREVKGLGLAGAASSESNKEGNGGYCFALTSYIFWKG